MKTPMPWCQVCSPLNTLPTRVLFDAGATHFFINPAIAKCLACVIEDMNVHLCVATPIGSVYPTDQIVRDCPIAVSYTHLTLPTKRIV